jgi:hypothetical protein
MKGKTIAYSHRGGYWKTRYTFLSRCYAYINRTFLSFGMAQYLRPLGVSNRFSGLVHRHDEDNVARTNFYGLGASGSGIAVTFNATPSQNKLYKAFSLESTNNVDGLTAFTVNNSSVLEQRKNVEAGPLQERGGIMYGHIGRDMRSASTNTSYVGHIVEVLPDIELVEADPPFTGQGVIAKLKMVFDDAGKNNMIFDPLMASKLWIDIRKGTQVSPRYLNHRYGVSAINLDAPVQDIETGFIYGSGFSSEWQAYDNMQMRARPLSIENNILTVKVNHDEGQWPGFDSWGLVDVVELIQENLAQYTVQDLIDGPNTNFWHASLFSVTPESINGEDPKGQTADAVVTLGSAPYELYALNVEYSPTNLDHSK